jgi:hypothetical protein
VARRQPAVLVLAAADDAVDDRPGVASDLFMCPWTVDDRLVTVAADPTALKINAGLLAAFRNHVERFVPAFADRIYTSWELFWLSERLSKVKVPDVEHRTADVVLYGTASRGIKTYRSVLYLCSLGFGPQAMMLNRSLIEDALTARWTELHRDEAMQRIDRHERHIPLRGNVEGART